MKKYKSTLYGVSALALAIGLSACTSEPNDDGGQGATDGGSDSGEPQEGGDFVLVMQSHASGLDPHQVNDVPSGQVQEQMFEGLLDFDDNLELQPQLAEDYEVEDNKIWFKLREGVTFHDGEPFNADAVKANIERITDEAVGSQRAFLFDEISEINVINDYEIEFFTEEPFAPLLYSFAHNGGFMISPAVIEEDYAAMEDGEQPYTAVNANPVGTGYFKYESGVAGSDDIVMTRNEDYWDEETYLDSVTFRVVPELTTRVSEVERGDAHFAEPVDSTSIPQIEAMSDASLIETESISASYYGFNTEIEPFDNPDVRRAIAMAINKETILNDLMDGYGRVASAPVPPRVDGHDENIESIEFDPEAAKELLEEAGVENLEVEIRTNDSDTRVRMANYMISALEEIGITATMNASDFPTYLEDTANGNHEMYILGWSSATAEADYALAPLFHSESSAASGNRSFYSNPDVDRLIEEAAVEIDEEKRQELYSEAQQIIVDDAPVVFTTYTNYLNVMRDNVHDFVISPQGGYNLHRTYFSN
ncbi:glutathione ABC transporter substrate-binding protein [Shouchella miscanthi]|uniref:glutathione ABC transporter substrate-binding protein n=1 Tax=Shouchella miscanthi TaxID=2598861 RepID=UPI0011A14092|nr:glutathione ABC transporter substrate-binding protein [Shouchella miscanthi]